MFLCDGVMFLIDCVMLYSDPFLFTQRQGYMLFNDRYMFIGDLKYLFFK